MNWVKILPYSPGQGTLWETMVKLFKNVNKTMENARYTPTPIELQTFFVNAVRIVNDRLLTTVSDQTNDLLPITPSGFLGQHLSPNCL